MPWDYSYTTLGILDGKCDLSPYVKLHKFELDFLSENPNKLVCGDNRFS